MTGEKQVLFDELVAAIEAQTGELSALESLLRAQQRSITGREFKVMLDGLPEQARRIEAIRGAQARRLDALFRLATELGLDGNKASLDTVAACLGGAAGTRLAARVADLRGAVESIGRTNSDNRRLIEHSLEFIDSVLGALSGRVPTPPTYAATGGLAPRPRLETLVDETA